MLMLFNKFSSDFNSIELRLVWVCLKVRLTFTKRDQPFHEMFQLTFYLAGIKESNNSGSKVISH